MMIGLLKILSTMVYHTEDTLIARGKTSPEMKQTSLNNPCATLNLMEELLWLAQIPKHTRGNLLRQADLVIAEADFLQSLCASKEKCDCLTVCNHTSLYLCMLNAIAKASGM